MNRKHNKGKHFVRAEVGENQKRILKTLSELRGVSTAELLQQVIERFIDSNLELIEDYNKKLATLNEETAKKITVNDYRL